MHRPTTKTLAPFFSLARDRLATYLLQENKQTRKRKSLALKERSTPALKRKEKTAKEIKEVQIDS